MSTKLSINEKNNLMEVNWLRRCLNVTFMTQISRHNHFTAQYNDWNTE